MVLTRSTSRSPARRQSTNEATSSPKKVRQRRRTPSKKGSSSGKSSVLVPVTETTGKEAEEKWKKWRTRTWTTLAMVFGGIALFSLSHWAVYGLLLVIQTGIFREIMQISYDKNRMTNVPVYRFMDWYMFFAISFIYHGRALISQFRVHITHVWLQPIVRYHYQLSGLLFVIGFVGFVLTLEKGRYRAQFTQLVWTLATLCLVIIQGSFSISNMFCGLIWLMTSASAVVMNDVSAYIWGFFYGRTPLIQLSPKKTWEGFIGAFVTTVVWMFLWSWLLAQFPYLTCPKTHPLIRPGDCEPHPVFIYQLYEFPSVVVGLLQQIGIERTGLWLLPFQLHAMNIGVMGSLVAPFGGFFASGFKRAFKVKDFGDSIPGHGGLTDRFDCQFLLGVLVYFYHITFIRPYSDTVALVQTLLSSMSLSDLEQVRSYLDILVGQAKESGLPQL